MAAEGAKNTTLKSSFITTWSVLFFVCLIIATLSYVLLLRNVFKEYKDHRQELSLKQEFLASVKYAIQERTDYAQEIANLTKELQQIEETLPIQATLPQFLEQVSHFAATADVNLEKFEIGKETASEFYPRLVIIPVHLVLEGSYLNIQNFFELLLHGSRLVRVKEWKFSIAKQNTQTPVLKVSMSIQVFRAGEVEEEEALPQMQEVRGNP